MKYIFVLLMAIMMISCGKKDDPTPKSALNIPLPAIDIKFTGEGVQLVNPSANSAVVVERAETDIGDLKMPKYHMIAKIDPKSTFMDMQTQPNTKYLYRFRLYYAKYNIYSEPVVRTVNYSGAMNLEKVKWTLTNDGVCINATASESVYRVGVAFDGEHVGNYDTQHACFTLPPLTKISMVLIPYSTSGTAGNAYSTDILRDTSKFLLPPQNVKILRRNGRVTISWDRANGATYRIYIDDEVINTHLTLMTVDVADNNCPVIRLSSIRGGKESQKVGMKLCQNN